MFFNSLMDFLSVTFLNQYCQPPLSKNIKYKVKIQIVTEMKLKYLSSRTSSVRSLFRKAAKFFLKD